MRVGLGILFFLTASQALVAQPPPPPVTVEVEGLAGSQVECESVTLSVREDLPNRKLSATLRVSLSVRLPDDAPAGAVVEQPLVRRVLTSDGVELRLMGANARPRGPAAPVDQAPAANAPAPPVELPARVGGLPGDLAPNLAEGDLVPAVSPGSREVAVPLEAPLPAGLSILDVKIPVRYPSNLASFDLEAKEGASTSHQGTTVTVTAARPDGQAFLAEVKWEPDGDNNHALAPKVELLNAQGQVIGTESNSTATRTVNGRSTGTHSLRAGNPEARPNRIRVRWAGQYEERAITARLRYVPVPRM